MSRVDATWLAAWKDREDLAWELVSDQIHDPVARDFFIGNGYIGQSVPPEGEGSWNLPDLQKPQPGQRAAGGCQIHGFTNREFLMDVPNWSGLRLITGRSAYGRLNGRHEHYRQVLNLKEGHVSTEVDWISGDLPETQRRVSLSYQMWLSRRQRNLAVIRCSFTADFDGAVLFEDRLDGSHCAEDMKVWEAADAPQQEMAVSAVMGSEQRPIFLASRICVESGEGQLSLVKDLPLCRQRRLHLKVKKGQSYVVTKLVAIFTGEDGDHAANRAYLLLKYAAEDLEQAFADHCEDWSRLWESDIQCSHKGVQRLARASLYQFYAQLRPEVQHSLGPTGITGMRQWSGRAFWDADLWMAPPVMLLHPELSKAMVAFRHHSLPGAQRNAQAEGREGARYAWESFINGDEICLGMTGQQLHQIGDIALVQWWYSLIADDPEYSRGPGAEVIIECARYFASRAIWNDAESRYEIHKVCCADEFSGIVNNNCYTNFAAIQTLALASGILEERGDAVPENWAEIREKMYLPYWEEKGFPLEHDSYTDWMIKQADVTLMIYPYDLGMSREEKERAIAFYRGQYPADKIMMSSAIDGVAFCDLGQKEQAWDCFLDLLPHFRQPCLHVSESPGNEVLSFATGLGGLLQLILNGFGGIRIVEEGLELKPALPADIEFLRITGLHCRGQRFDLELRQDSVSCKGLPENSGFSIRCSSDLKQEGLPDAG